MYLTRGRISRSGGGGGGGRNPASRVTKCSRRRRREIASAELDPNGGLNPAIYHSFSHSDLQVGGACHHRFHREFSHRARERTRPRLRQGRSDTQRLTCAHNEKREYMTCNIMSRSFFLFFSPLIYGIYKIMKKSRPCTRC